jgi:predicted HAD superfamily Cof-like phosphohydrolase
MNDMYQDVYDFHDKFGCYIGDKPSVPDIGTKELRKNIVKEEYDELIDAIDNNDLPEIADGIADLIYVLLGTAVSYGIDIRPIWEEVQRTNMAKIGGSKRSDGKILKPEGWVGPDIKGLLEKQCI